MARAKRKRNWTPKQPTKKQKSLEDGWFEAERILDERDNEAGVKEYLIKWAGLDPNTGKEYPSDWQTEVTTTLLDFWEKRNTQQTARLSVQESSPQASITETPSRRNSGRRVVESSPTTSITQASSSASPGAGPARQSIPGLCSNSLPTTTHRLSPKVALPPRPGDFVSQEWDPYSQLPKESAEDTQDTSLDSSQLFTAASPNLLGVVPDSQSSKGEETFVPTTQQTDSTNTGDLQEDATEDPVRWQYPNITKGALADSRFRDCLD